MGSGFFYDCHAHIDMLSPEQLKALQQSRDVRVAAASVGIASFEKVKKIRESAEKQKSGFVYRLGLALHPEFAAKNHAEELAQILVLLERGEAGFIGECGLDPKYGSAALQEHVFRAFCEAAEKHCLALQVHSRNAVEHVLEVLGEFPHAKVMMHWFSGNANELKEALQRGYFIGITPATSERTGFVKSISAGQLLLETDSPVHGKTPLDVKELYARVAGIRGIAEESLKRQIEINVKEFFG